MEDIKTIMEQNKTFNNSVIKRINGFVMINNSLVFSKHKFNIQEKMILIVIVAHKMGKKTSWPAIKTIAEEAGCGETTVKKYIKTLEQKKMLEIKPDEKKRSNVYSCTTDAYRRLTAM